MVKTQFVPLVNGEFLKTDKGNEPTINHSILSSIQGLPELYIQRSQ